MSVCPNKIHEGSIFLSPVQYFIQCFVGVFITLDSVQKVFHRLVRVTVGVVWTAELHLLKHTGHKMLQKTNEYRLPCLVKIQTRASYHNVLLNDIWVFAHRLDEEQFEAILLRKLKNGIPSFPGGVCGIENLQQIWQPNASG